MQVHRRQFLIGPRPAAPSDDWRSVELGHGLHLSYCPALPVRLTDAGALLGVAVRTLATRPQPLDEAAATDTEPSLVDDWAGRWILVSHGTLRTDAAGTFGCLYRTLGGQLWVSSSPALLRELEPKLGLPAAEITHAQGLDWYPPPETGILGIRRLLPSQILDLSSGAIVARPLLPPLSIADPEQNLNRLADRLVTAVESLAALTPELWVPLSGGRDSRLLLAAASAAGVPVKTYTCDKPDLDRGDRELPPRLAAAVGAPHVIMHARAEDPERLARFDAHTARHVVDVDRAFFARGQLDAPPYGALELGGGVFEAGRSYYHVLPQCLCATPEETANVVLATLPSERPDGVLAWAEWLHATHDPAYPWRDRFYIEQRCAGWLAAIAQALDLAPASRVHIASCGGYLADTMGIPESVRRAGQHQERLVERLAPSLARLPYNPPESLRARMAGRLRREITLMQEAPGPSRYLTDRARRFAEKRNARAFGRG